MTALSMQLCHVCWTGYSHEEYATSLLFSNKEVAPLQHSLFAQFCAAKHKHFSNICGQDTSLAKQAVQAAVLRRYCEKHCMHAELACNLKSMPPMHNNKPLAYRAAALIVQ